MNQAIVDTLLEQPAGAPIAEALSILLERDGYLLKVDANERSIIHRFAMYLQGQLPKFHVDCEYNRDGIDPKRIEHFYVSPDLEDTEAKTAFPDVIAHIRGTNKNYLVIELKKTTNNVDRMFDFAKLRGYKHNLGYEYALFIELAAAGEPDVLRVEWVEATIGLTRDASQGAPRL